MKFTPIDLKTWHRKEYFEHYFSEVPCTYSMTVKLDVTSVFERGRRLHPTLLYCLAAAVNRHEEYRTAFNEKGELGIYDVVHPSYTAFHKDTQTFSVLWTEFCPDYEQFCAAYRKDLAEYGNKEGFSPKPDMPQNTFSVSMIPWASFEGFHLDLQKGYGYLAPIFTMGKCRKEGGRTLLPLAVQVHHAVCDGFHTCRLIDELQKILDE